MIDLNAQDSQTESLSCVKVSSFAFLLSLVHYMLSLQGKIKKKVYQNNVTLQFCDVDVEP